MDKKSKVISGLKTGKIIIQKPNKYFTDSEKHHIIQELLSLGCTKREIWEKYTGQEEEHGQLLRWMKQLGYDASVKTRRPNFTTENVVNMAKKDNGNTKTIEDFETLQLKKRISELESQLKDAEMKAILFSTMVDIAEKEFNIPIRKKYNTKPLKK
ncbi:MAG: transposase [Bacteroidetes bacterium OLB11]|nr:MAG: transposase [Bacteroidetes bacterium OLB11]